MNSTRESPDSSRNGKRGISMPDMAPFAGVVFILSLFYMSTGRFRSLETGIVKLEQLVAHTPISCSKGIDSNNSMIISLNTKNQLSFAVPAFDGKVQAEIFRRVASIHHVNLTKPQIDALATLPFLAVNARELPAFLNLSPVERLQMLQYGMDETLDSLQLVECIKMSRVVARQNHRYGPFVYLQIDAEVRMPQVERLIALLNAQEINRFILLTQSNHIDYPLALPTIRTQ